MSADSYETIFRYLKHQHILKSLDNRQKLFETSLSWHKRSYISFTTVSRGCPDILRSLYGCRTFSLVTNIHIVQQCGVLCNRWILSSDLKPCLPQNASVNYPYFINGGMKYSSMEFWSQPKVISFSFLAASQERNNYHFLLVSQLMETSNEERTLTAGSSV